MIATVLHLTRDDIAALRITDTYSVHRIIYSLFDDIRSEEQKQRSEPSGFLYAEKRGDWNCRKFLILSNRPPKIPKYGQIDTKPIPESFLTNAYYGFEVTLNPSKRESSSGKIVAIRGREAISQWFIDKAPNSWGFTVNSESLQVQSLDVQTFDKQGHKVTQGSATLVGELVVTDRDKFIQSFRQGIGRGRAFGLGLLQIIPLSKLNKS